jgi:hypothetical protein
MRRQRQQAFEQRDPLAHVPAAAGKILLDLAQVGRPFARRRRSGLLVREKSRQLWHHRIRPRCFGQESPGAAQRCWAENREGGASPPRAQRCKEDGRCIGH